MRLLGCNPSSQLRSSSSIGIGIATPNRESTSSPPPPARLSALLPSAMNRTLASRTPTPSPSSKVIGSKCPPTAATAASSSGQPGQEQRLQQQQQRLGEAAAKALSRAARAAMLYGWISFAVQLVLGIASSIILLFSVAFTPQNAMSMSLYLTLVGIVSGFSSCIWNFRYTRIAQRMQRYLNIALVGGAGAPSIAVRKQDVIDFVVKGVMINVIGMGSTLMGILGLVWVLVLQTLKNATSSLGVDSVVDVFHPILTLDVFLVQAATNSLLGHFLSLVCSLWLLNILGEGRGLRFQRFIGIQRLKRRVESNTVLSKGNALVFQLDSMPGAPRGLPAPRGDAKPRGGPGKAGAAGSKSRPSVGASTTTAAVAFSAAARQMQQDSELGAAGHRPLSAALRGLRSGGADAAAARPLILATPRSLQYLDGSLPGDYGFDPLGFFDPASASTGIVGSPEWLRYSEIIHSRWAMLGVMGCLVPDALETTGALPLESGGAMWLSAAVAASPPPLVAGLALLTAAVELRRLQDFLDPGGTGAVSASLRPLLEVEAQLGMSSRATGDPAYPGGPTFNSLQIVRDSSPSLFGFKEVELTNGRLAMIALVGFASQGLVTGVGPYWNLKDHMSDPLYHNIIFEL